MNETQYDVYCTILAQNLVALDSLRHLKLPIQKPLTAWKVTNLRRQVSKRAITSRPLPC